MKLKSHLCVQIITKAANAHSSFFVPVADEDLYTRLGFIRISPMDFDLKKGYTPMVSEEIRGN